MRKHELENKGFVDSIVFSAREHLRIWPSMVLRSVVDWFDTWRWFLTLLAIYFFFGYILPLPAILLGFHYGGIFAYIWFGLWTCVFILVAVREDKRRNKARTYNKWSYHPNAVKEYVELLNKQKKKT